jgi:predicted ATP-grasp superfamily ATP-dependent carboligase
MSHSTKAISFRSKYCAKAHKCRSPNDPLYHEDLLSIATSGRYDVLLPIGLRANIESSRIKALLPTSVPVADYRSMLTAGNKSSAIRLAERVGVPVPRTHTAESKSEAIRSSRGLGFPVVLKTCFGSGGKGTRIAVDENEVEKHYSELVGLTPPPEPLLVQEYVEGNGFGYSALMNRGKPLAEFVHMRIHELPASGGASTKAKSMSSADLTGMGRSILSELGWTGVAMVEFRGVVDKRCSMIEINPKFWGSLDLAMAAGIDFPLLTCQMAMGEFCRAAKERVGATYRWMLPDLKHSLETGKLLHFLLDFLDPRTRDDLDLDDPTPVACDVREMLLELLRHSAS